MRPYDKGGLVLHQLYYANEVRSFAEIDAGARFTFSDIERDLAEKLIEQLTNAAFDPSKYSDGYDVRVRAAVEQKVAGQEITLAPEAPRAQIIDLFEALKKSLADAQERTANSQAEPPLKPPVKTVSAEEPVAEKKVAARRTRAKK